LLLGEKLDGTLPADDYLSFYRPENSLFIQPTNMENANTPKFLAKIKGVLLDRLRELPAPSVQYSTPIGDESQARQVAGEGEAVAAKAENDQDSRDTQQQADARVDDKREFFAGEKDNDASAQGMDTAVE
jgi:hypothetical protein